MARRPAFDPRALLEIKRARTVGGVLRQLGPVGRRNGPRTGVGRRTTVSSEAYFVRRFILDAVKRGRLTFPISVVHGDAPDFVITHRGGVLHLEVTEASPARDGHLFATEKGVRPIGEYSETGTEKAIDDLKTQLQDAIDRKGTKRYASAGTSLLIYPNSEASQWCHFFVRSSRPPFLKGLNVAPFETVFVFWEGDRIFEIKQARS